MNKQIEEMAKIIAKTHCSMDENGLCREDGNICDLDCPIGINLTECAEALYNAGYRKEKETAREILQKVYDEFACFTDDSIYEGGEIKDIIRAIAKIHGVEVE